MHRGYVKLHRSLTNHPLWSSEPFTRGQAWVDLLMLANHKPGIIRKQGIRIDVDRGDVGWSENELAARWQWSRGKVRRFLDELVADDMILRKCSTNFCQKTVQANGQKTDKRKFIITILNYDKFQIGDALDGTSHGTSHSTGDGQATDKRRYKNKNEDNENNDEEHSSPQKDCGVAESSPAPKTPPKESKGYTQEFEAFWNEYPRRSKNGSKGNKAEAFSEWVKAIAGGVSGQTMIERIKVLGPLYGGMSKDACRWIKYRGWEDDLKTESAQTQKLVGVL